MLNKFLTFIVIYEIIYSDKGEKNMKKAFEQLELGDFLAFRKEMKDYEMTVEIGGFIEEVGTDYVKINRGAEEPKWMLTKEYFEQNKRYFKVII